MMRAFPSERSDGSSEVDLVFRSPGDVDMSAVFAEAIERWRTPLDAETRAQDLKAMPEAVSTAEDFRIRLRIQPASRRWRDWAVLLVSEMRIAAAEAEFEGFFDALTGRMHSGPGSRPLNGGADPQVPPQ